MDGTGSHVGRTNLRVSEQLQLAVPHGRLGYKRLHRPVPTVLLNSQKPRNFSEFNSPVALSIRPGPRQKEYSSFLLRLRRCRFSVLQSRNADVCAHPCPCIRQMFVKRPGRFVVTQSKLVLVDAAETLKGGTCATRTC